MQTAPQQVGSYALTGLLGQGGMGAVYRARHVELGHERAVKLLAGARTPVQAERFLRESRALARLRHPGVVAVHESGDENGILYYVMDLVEGEPLEEALQRDRFGYERALEVAIALCQGVQALHAEGIVHRDLKPANVMLDPSGAPVVLDLGLALDPESDRRLTQTGALLGTPFYMSPEQARGKRATAASDVYALGLMIHELLSGYSVAGSGELPGFVQVPSPSSVDGTLPRALDAIVSRALAEDPAARFQSAGELAGALQALAAWPGLTRRALRGLQLGVALAVCAVLVGVALTWPTPERAAPPAQVAEGGPSSPGGERPAVDPTPGRRALRGALRVDSLRRKVSELEAWLEEYPDHPDVAEARGHLDEARLRQPLHWLVEGRLATDGHSRAAWLGSERAVVTDQRGRVALFDLSAEPRQVRSWSLPGDADALVAAPDGARFAVATSNVGVFLIDAEGGEPRLLRERPTRALAFTPSGGGLAMGGGHPEVKVAALESGLTLQALGPGGKVRSLAYSPDGLHLAVGTGGKLNLMSGKTDGIALWDVASEELVWSQAQLSKVNCVAFLPDGRSFLAGRSDGRLARYGLKSSEPEGWYAAAEPGLRVREHNRAHPENVDGVAVSPDGRLLYSVGPSRDNKRGLRRIWDVATRELLAEVEHRQPLSGVCVSPDGARLLVACRDGVAVWSARVPGAHSGR